MKLIKQSSYVRACSVRIKGKFKHYSGWSRSTLLIFECHFTAHKELHYWSVYVISLWIICILYLFQPCPIKFANFKPIEGNNTFYHTIHVIWKGNNSVLVCFQQYKICSLSESKLKLKANIKRYKGKKIKY